MRKVIINFCLCLFSLNSLFSQETNPSEDEEYIIRDDFSMLLETNVLVIKQTDTIPIFDNLSTSYGRICMFLTFDTNTILQDTLRLVSINIKQIRLVDSTTRQYGGLVFGGTEIFREGFLENTDSYMFDQKKREFVEHEVLKMMKTWTFISKKRRRLESTYYYEIFVFFR